MSNISDHLKDIAESYWQRLTACTALAPELQRQEKIIKQAFALSDFVADSVLNQPDLLVTLLEQGLLENPQPDFVNDLDKEIDDTDEETKLYRRLRHFRRLHMLRIAWRDLTDRQDIQTSLLQVSELADCLVKGAYQWLYRTACQRYGTPTGEQGPQPLLILAMGKLGGRELNFSSDIDLIFTYPSQGQTQGGRKPIEHQQFFTKLAQKLISALHQITADGQVFRVDMRLRPFGESGPLVSHFNAFEDYYQDQGREWERYAMIKARLINPGSAYDEDLNRILHPFVYRRYLDFNAIDSLRNMKQLINQEVRRRKLTDNIKLGAGGIREVEFIVQSFQLIRGGREPDLQHTGLLDSLQQLEAVQALTAEEVTQLRSSYLYLRKVEHSLQQFADQQTQTLPTDTTNQQRLVAVTGEPSYADFLAKLHQHMDGIHRQFQSIIGDAEPGSSASSSPEQDELADLWQLDLPLQEQQQLLDSKLDKDQCETWISQLNDFKSALQKKGLSQRGQDTLTSLMPNLLTLTIDNREAKPAILLPRLLSLLQAILGRTTYLQLLNEHPGAQTQLVRLCAASPWISDQLSRFPILLDELLNPASLYAPTALDQYKHELRQTMLRIEPNDLEMQMEALRQFKLTQQLKIAAADVTGVLPVMQVSDHLTYLAEAIIEEVVNLAWQQIKDKYGVPSNKRAQNKGFGVIGYGKLGGIELGYGSDLDLVFVHDSGADSHTDGIKSISAQQFYTKLAQRIIHLFGTKTASGQLYEVDMRLRPSGNAGLLVCHLDAFAKYQLQEAWTWEHQALVRARFISGPGSLQQMFAQIRHEVLSLSRRPNELSRQVVEMREKMRTHLSQGSPQCFDIKQGSGGIADIEFLVQYWTLAHSATHPSLPKWSDNVRILESLSEQKIINKHQAELLTQAYLTYRNTNHRLALQGHKLVKRAAQFADMRSQVITLWQSTFAD